MRCPSPRVDEDGYLIMEDTHSPEDQIALRICITIIGYPSGFALIANMATDGNVIAMIACAAVGCLCSCVSVYVLECDGCSEDRGNHDTQADEENQNRCGSWAAYCCPSNESNEVISR